jgi:hypothetical protein
MTTMIKQSVLICTVIAVAAIGSLIALDTYGKSNRVYPGAGRLDAREVEKIMVEIPAEAYSAWKSRGFKGRTVLFVSDKWERLDGTVEPPVSRPYPLNVYRLPELWERAELTSANFLYVASLNRIIRRIVAILPQKEYDQVAERARIAKDFRIGSGEVYFPYQGFPRWFTTGAGFKGEKEPVLLYVSAAYFKNADPEELFRQLTGAGVAADCVILCTASGDAGVTERERNRLIRFARLAGFSPRSGSLED